MKPHVGKYSRYVAQQSSKKDPGSFRNRVCWAAFRDPFRANACSAGEIAGDFWCAHERGVPTEAGASKATADKF